MTRFGYVMTAYFASLATVGTAFLSPSPRLIWNASASIPTGLYAVRPARHAGPGELVAVTPPDALAAYLADRHYLPRGVPLLKRVAAVSGQRVCRNGTRVSIDRRIVGEALRRDRSGRVLPVWRGCHRLSRGEIFVMNAQVPDSFDGRYFGPLPTATIIGRLSPLWVRTRSGHLVDGGAAPSRSGDSRPATELK